MMKDIFDAKIMCKECNSEMRPTFAEKNGFEIRAVKCASCGDTILHPADLSKFQQYDDLKRKTYTVKLRMVGNSHAVSIPKEIVDFINEMNHKMDSHMNDMVKLCFEDFGKISLNFFDDAPRENKRIGFEEERKIKW